MANALVHMSLLVMGSGAIKKISETNSGPPHTLDSLTHIYCYIDDMITAVQSWLELQRQVSNVTVLALK